MKLWEFTDLVTQCMIKPYVKRGRPTRYRGMVISLVMASYVMLRIIIIQIVIAVKLIPEVLAGIVQYCKLIHQGIIYIPVCICVAKKWQKHKCEFIQRRIRWAWSDIWIG